MPRENEWDSRWWSPIINAEHLAMRERAGIVDLTAFSIFDVVGKGAFDAVQRIAVGQMNVAPGRVVYTPIIDSRGGFRADLTIMRLGDNHFRVVTGGAHGNLDRKWFRDHMPADGSAQVVDQTSAFTTIGVWGPKARDILGNLTESDISHEAFKFGTCQSLELGSIDVLASRISYVGELGWELYVPMESGAKLWDLIREAGDPHGLVPSASVSTARPDAWRRATAPTAPSSTASGPSSRPACSGPRSRRPTSSAARPTSSSAPRTPRP